MLKCTVLRNWFCIMPEMWLLHLCQYFNPLSKRQNGVLVFEFTRFNWPFIFSGLNLPKFMLLHWWSVNIHRIQVTGVQFVHWASGWKTKEFQHWRVSILFLCCHCWMAGWIEPRWRRGVERDRSGVGSRAHRLGQTHKKSNYGQVTYNSFIK